MYNIADWALEPFWKKAELWLCQAVTSMSCPMQRWFADLGL